MKTKIKAIFGLTVFLFSIPMILDAEPSSLRDGEIEYVTKKVYPCVVRVEARNMIRKVATGVVIDKDSRIVTTALITPRDEKIFVTTSEGERIEADFLGMDAETHLALIQAKKKNLPAIKVSKPKDFSPGAWVGVVSMSFENTPQVTQGIISSVGRDKLLLNVWVGPGMSGSPVVDKDGQMVGLLRGAYVDERPIVFEFREKEMVGSGYVFSRAEAPASGMAMALPARVVEYVASEIRDKGKVARGWLGVRIIMNDEKRVEIIEVEKDSPAELAALEKGDIVLKFEGQDIENTESLAHMIRMQKPGDSVTITVERDGKVQDVDVKLGEYTEEDAREEFERKFPRLFSRPEREFRIPEKIEPEIYRWGFEQRKYIGVFIDELNEDLSKFFGVEEGKGLLVARIEKDSPAGKAGLKVGDVIIKADGNRVETTRELSELIQDKKKDDTITVEFLRDKKKQTVDVKVEEEEKSPNLFYGDAGEYLNFWREYQGTLQDQYQRIQENYQKWQDVRSKEYERRIKSMNEELQKQLQKQREETQKSYKRVLSKYRGIRV